MRDNDSFGSTIVDVESTFFSLLVTLCMYIKKSWASVKDYTGQKAVLIMSFPCKHFNTLRAHFTMLFALVSGNQLPLKIAVCLDKIV